MDAGDARARVAGAMGWRARLADVAGFVLRPTFAAQPMAPGRAAATALAVVVALSVVILTLMRLLLTMLDQYMGFLPAPAEQRFGIDDLVWPLVFAPVLEELAFRGWLTGRIAALRFAGYGFVALALLLADYSVGEGAAGWLPILAVGAVFAGLIQWGLTRHRDRHVPAWFTRRFHWIVWGSAGLFGVIHLGNFGPVPGPLGVLVVLPQVIGGVLLAYTRTRLGLAAAMLHHAAYNAVYLWII